MPTKPPSDRTRAKGVHPMIKPHLQCGMRPTPRKCETNPIHPHGHLDYAKRTQSQPAVHPNYAKRTQSHPHGTPITRNEPNLPRPTTQLRKTNPILVPLASSRPDRAPKYAKRTQFPATNIHSTILIFWCGFFGKGFADGATGGIINTTRWVASREMTLD